MCSEKTASQATLLRRGISETTGDQIRQPHPFSSAIVEHKLLSINYITLQLHRKHNS